MSADRRELQIWIWLHLLLFTYSCLSSALFQCFCSLDLFFCFRSSSAYRWAGLKSLKWEWYKSQWCWCVWIVDHFILKEHHCGRRFQSLKAFSSRSTLFLLHRWEIKSDDEQKANIYKCIPVVQLVWMFQLFMGLKVMGLNMLLLWIKMSTKCINVRHCFLCWFVILRFTQSLRYKMSTKKINGDLNKGFRFSL